MVFVYPSLRDRDRCILVSVVWLLHRISAVLRWPIRLPNSIRIRKLFAWRRVAFLFLPADQDESNQGEEGKSKYSANYATNDRA
jgi:hypothetical protein